jgi:hypothetical protein
VPLFGIPLDPNNMLRRILAAARDLITLAVLGSLKCLSRAPIGVLERVCPAIVDAVADALNDHWSPPHLADLAGAFGLQQLGESPNGTPEVGTYGAVPV